MQLTRINILFSMKKGWTIEHLSYFFTNWLHNLPPDSNSGPLLREYKNSIKASLLLPISLKDKDHLRSLEKEKVNGRITIIFQCFSFSVFLNSTRVDTCSLKYLLDTYMKDFFPLIFLETKNLTSKPKGHMTLWKTREKRVPYHTSNLFSNRFCVGIFSRYGLNDVKAYQSFYPFAS